jgi:hypothetical protein
MHTGRESVSQGIGVNRCQRAIVPDIRIICSLAPNFPLKFKDLTLAIFQPEDTTTS